MPATSLPAREQHLEARLLELDKLHHSRPGLPTAMSRAEAGQRIDDLLDEIAELQRMIDTSPAETLEDAVKLRRLGAYVDGDSRRGCWRGRWGPWNGRRRSKPIRGLGLVLGDHLVAGPRRPGGHADALQVPVRTPR